MRRWGRAIVLLSAVLSVAGAPPSAARAGGPAARQEAQLVVSPPHPESLVGYAVAVSGDTAMVGAPSRSVDGHDFAGAVFVFTHTDAGWAPSQELAASDLAYGDGFGLSIAISGNTAVIGAPFRDVGADADSGTAYVFTRTATTWAQTAELTASDHYADDWFGSSVAISGNVVVVGAPKPSNGTTTDPGAAYLFTGREPRGRRRRSSPPAPVQLPTHSALRSRSPGPSRSSARRGGR